VSEDVAERFRRSEIVELLARYPGLRLVPSGSMALRVEGTLRFTIRLSAGTGSQNRCLLEEESRQHAV